MSDDGSIIADSVAGDGDPVTVGRVFAGRYQVLREVGRGAMGTVYAVTDQILGEPVALKVLRARVDDPVVLERFRREVRLARKVAHPNAARTYDIGEHGGVHYMTMELVEGSTLSALLSRHGRLEVARATGLAQKLCHGLQAAHEVGVIHRDLKPGNVLLDPNGRAVITDFGVARMLAGDDALTWDPRAMVGTPAYMAPEQVSGGQLGSYTDIYAVGVILYRMLTGVLPFREPTALATALARLEREPEDPGQRVPLPSELSALVLRCLAREVEPRPRSARELADRLLPFTGGPDEQTLAAERPAEATQLQHGGGSSSFAPVGVGDQCLVVLPLRYRGPPGDAYLAEAITEELVDLLSMTRSLKVLSTGASVRFAEQRDPVAVREALGAHVVVDGSVQRSGERLRVAVRLIDTRTGIQVWSERFDGRLGDVLELQERIAHHIAETLRLQLVARRYGARVSEDAIELYLRARHQAVRFDLGGVGPDGAVALLERCLQRAPGFPPAIAGRALAYARLWFLHGRGEAGQDWPMRCCDAVEVALEDAPEQPETHLAAARMHVQHGEFRSAALALKLALELAPTYAAAHAYLGTLQCEAGRAHEGYRHIMLAVELEPTDLMSLLSAARHHGLRAEYQQAQAILDRTWAEDPTTRSAIAIGRLRMSLWRQRPQEVQAQRSSWSEVDRPRRQLLELLGAVYLGQLETGALDQALGPALAGASSPRFTSLAYQLAAEVLAACGDEDGAFEHVRRAAAEVLVDVDWLARCPVLAGVRARPGFAELQARVQQRAAAIWSTS